MGHCVYQILLLLQLLITSCSFTFGRRRNFLFNPTIFVLKAQQQYNPESLNLRSKSWIVLVDDEESIRMSIGKYLYDSGYTVTACSDGEALLELLTSASTGGASLASRGSSTASLDIESMPTKLPSVIICDIRMPNGMDGLQVLDILKNNPSSTSQLIPNTEAAANSPASAAEVSSDLDFIRMQWKTIPVIMLTAKSLTQDRIEGYKRGANVYLSKPFAPEELLSIVDNLVRRMKELNTRTSKRGINADDVTNLNNVKSDIIEIKALLKSTRELADKRRKDSIRGNKGSLNILKSASSSPTLSSAIVTKESANKWQEELDEIRRKVTLTPTEIDVLKLLSEGHSNSEIANLADISAVRVGKTISMLYSKTLTKTRTELVRWGIRMGFVPAR